MKVSPAHIPTAPYWQRADFHLWKLRHPSALTKNQCSTTIIKGNCCPSSTNKHLAGHADNRADNLDEPSCSVQGEQPLGHLHTAYKSQLFDCCSWIIILPALLVSHPSMSPLSFQHRTDFFLENISTSLQDLPGTRGDGQQDSRA